MGKRITIKELAEQLGVSTATVSRALNDTYGISEQLKKKIKIHAQKSGYQPDSLAVNLRKKATKTIGLVVPSLAYNFNIRALKGIESILYPHGYKVLIFQTMESYQREKEAIEYLLSVKVDGIIASLASETNQLDHLHRVREQEKPLVLIDRTSSAVEATKIVIDNERSSYQAVKHLLMQGCRQIGWISGPQELPLAGLRQRGYEKALEEFHIPFNQDLICYCSFNGDMGFAASQNMIRENPQIDGLFAINDRFAIGAMAAVHTMKKSIPGEIAVVGFNNEPFDPLINPALSSVYQPASAMGTEAARLMLVHLKETPFKPQHRIFETKLVVRQSSNRQSDPSHDTAGHQELSGQLHYRYE